MTALKIITAPSGARFSVAAEHADRFQALVNDLEAAGYPIKGDQSGGYNKRNIAGTDTPSQHSFGRAIDVNWNENARGKPGAIPENVALELAKKHGLTWGGTWKNRDDMHFEVADTSPRPMSERGLTSFAGLTPPMPTNEAPMDPMTIIASLFGKGGGTTPAAAPGQGTGKMPFSLAPSKEEQEALAKLQNQQQPTQLRSPFANSTLSLRQLATLRGGGLG